MNTDLPKEEMVANIAAQQLAELDKRRMALSANILALLQRVGEASICKGCKAPVFFVEHRSGNTGIYDPDGTTHFATCPQAPNFRRKNNVR